MLPDQAIKEEFHTLVVQTAEGQVFQGIVADRDDKRIVLKEATGALRTVPAADVEATKEGGSLMPKGLVNFLTRAELVDLVRFLSELG
jgi:putative heme-binding domain-containing protein